MKKKKILAIPRTMGRAETGFTAGGVTKTFRAGATATYIDDPAVAREAEAKYGIKTGDGSMLFHDDDKTAWALDGDGHDIDERGKVSRLHRWQFNGLDIPFASRAEKEWLKSEYPEIYAARLRGEKVPIPKEAQKRRESAEVKDEHKPRPTA